MPELPEVETTCRGLAARLLGHTIATIEQRRKNLRTPMPKGLLGLGGSSIQAVARRAKYILIRLDNGQTLLVHLGMSGRLTVADRDDGARDKHDHVVLTFTSGRVLRFNDARRFGRVDLFATTAENTTPLLAALGPEPLDAAFTPDILSAALQGRKTAIKQALLDQRIVAGIGNIYASEALFYAGISPRRPAGTVAGTRAKALVPAIQKVLQAAIAAGGSSLRDYVQTSGELGFYQDKFAVYDREGQPCPDCTCGAGEGGGIRRLVQGGRATFFCATKQR